MAGGKQTPRQKLIGLMYLVFLALMALNVSVEVLDSFPLINEGLEQTNKNFELKVDMVYRDFDQQKAISEEKVQPFYDEANQVRELANDLVEFIIEQRNLMVAELNDISPTEAADLNLHDLKKKDNYSISSRFWLREGVQEASLDGGRGTRAFELRERIENFKEEIAGIMATHNLTDFIQVGLDVEGPFYRQDTEITWQQLMFDRVISVAVATNLSRLITEVRNAEFDAINLLYGAITADDFKFDQIEARVVPNSQIVLLNDHYEADIFVAAIDTRQNPEIFVGGRQIPTTDGIGRLRIPATSTGPQTHRGIIRLISPTGYPQEYPFTAQYIVERPSVTVSADRMNLFYVGVPNPVSISAPGIPTGNIRPVISAGGTLSRQSDGSYIVQVQPGTREINITVNAVVDGATRSMGTSNFRVRNVPDPVAFIANRREGRITREELLLARAIIPRMENFEFDLNFEIESFSMVTTMAGDVRTYRANGNQFTQEMIQVITNAGRGQRFIFENITTRPGPDGRVRTLSPLSFTIN
ncbi:MAG: gliding motility protein GldM [Bacteroidales bacterium]